MFKKNKQKQAKPSYRIKSAIVKCISVPDGETFIAVWKERRWLRKHDRRVVIRLVKVECPGVRSNKSRRTQEAGRESIVLQELQLSAKGAAEATVFLRKMIDGQEVMIEYAQYPNGEIIKDERGRILAMVFITNFLGMKGKNLNLEQIKRGNAEVYTSDSSKDPYYWSTVKYDREFEKAYKDAERHRRGPLHKDKKPKDITKKPEIRLMYIYCLLSFLLGLLLGFLTFALLLGQPP